MLKSLDRIKELTSTTGTGTLTLTGAESGFQAFSVLGNGTKCYYTITDVNGTDFEVGQGTYNTNTLTRDTIFESSNSGNAISLSATGSTVFVTYPAEKSSYRDIGVNRDYTASGSITAGKPLILNADNTVSQVATTTSSDVAISNTTGAGIVDSSSSEKQAFNFYCSAQNTFVAGYIASNGYPTIVAYTVATDGSVTSGTPVALKSIGSYTIDGILTSGSTVVFTYGNNSGDPTYGYIRAGTLSGTTFTLGTELEVSSASNYYNYMYCSLGYDSNADAGLVTYSYNSTETIASASIKSKVFTLSGTTITLGSETAIDTTTGKFGNFTWGYYGVGSCLKTVFDPDNNLIVSIRSYPTGQGTESVDAYVGTITGGSTRSVSWGAKQTIKANTAGSDGTNQPKYVKQIGAIYDTINNRLLIGNVDDNSSNLVANWKTDISNCTINSNSTITVNSSTEVATFRNYPSFAFINENNSYLFVLSANEYYDNSAYDVFYKVVPSSTAVTVSTLHTSNFGSKYTGGIAYNSTDKTTGYLTYWYANSTDFTYDLVVRSGGFSTNVNLTNDNYFGIASTTASTTEPVGVNRAGSFNNDQTGMTAGKDMYVTDAGLIKERTTTTTTPDTNPTVSIALDTSFYSQSNGVSGGGMAYESTSGTYVVFASNQGNNQYPTLMAGTLSNGTMTYGTPLVVNSANSGSGFSNYICAGNGKIYVSFHSYESSYWYVWCKWYTISGTTFTGNSAGNVSLVTTSTTRQISTTCGYDSNADRVIFGYAVNDSTVKDLYYRTAEVTATGFTLGTVLSIGSTKSADNTDVSIGLEYDNNAQRFVLAYLDGSTVYPEACVLEVGSSTITKGTEVTLINEIGTQARPFASTYDSVNNKITLLWRSDAVSSGYAYYTTILTVNSATNSFTFTTPAQIFSPNTGDGYQIEYDASTSKFLVLLDKQAPSYDNDVYMLIFTSNGSALTLISTTLVNTSKIDGSIAGATSSNGTAFYGRLDNGSNNNATITAYFGSTTSTVVNGSQFVGTARSGTDLELSEPPTELVAMANGSITKGKPVIVKTDGDFQQAGLVPTAIPYSAGTETPVSTEDNYFNGVSYNPDQNRYVAFYSESNFSYYGYAKSFTVTDKVISNIVGMGAFHTSSTGVVDCCYIGNSKHIVFFTDGSSYVNAVAVQLASDGTATYGTKVTINSSSSESNGSCYYDSDKDVAVITMGMDTNTGKSIAVSVSGLTITAGSKVTVPSSDSNVYYTSSSYNTEEKIGLVVWDSGSTSKLNSATISLSGTGNRTITFNSVLEVYNGSNEIKKGSLTYDSLNKKHFLAYSDASNMKGVVLTVSGTSVTKGTSATIYTGGETNIATQGTNQGGISIYHRDASSPYYLKGVVATISGTDFTLSNEATLNATEIKNGRFGNAVYNPSDFTTTVIYVVTASFDLKATATIPNGSLSSTNLTSSNFIGFAQDTVADNEDVKVAVISQSDFNQTGLTTASQYYVQNDGTLSTTAGTPSVLGGTALSSSKILIKS